MPSLRSLKVTLIRHGESEDNQNGICKSQLLIERIRYNLKQSVDTHQSSIPSYFHSQGLDSKIRH